MPHFADPGQPLIMLNQEPRMVNQAEDCFGVTVALLHKGTRYADDLASDGVLYHYPETRRPPGRDLAEVEATKAAGRLKLPVFVISQPRPIAKTRDVQLGWVEDWDDGSRLFLVTLGERAAARRRVAEEEAPFYLTDAQRSMKTQATARPGQQRFKFRFIQRYGPACAVCGIAEFEVLDAAHIRPKEEGRGRRPAERTGALCAASSRLGRGPLRD